MELIEISQFLDEEEHSGPGNIIPVENKLSHRQNCLVKFFTEIIVVLVQCGAEEIIRKVEEGETVEGAENVDDLAPVREKVVSEVQLPHVPDLVSQLPKGPEAFNIVIIESHQRREHSRLGLRAGRHENNEGEVLGFIFPLPVFLVNT